MKTSCGIICHLNISLSSFIRYSSILSFYLTTFYNFIISDFVLVQLRCFSVPRLTTWYQTLLWWLIDWNIEQIKITPKTPILDISFSCNKRPGDAIASKLQKICQLINIMSMFLSQRGWTMLELDWLFLWWTGCSCCHEIWNVKFISSKYGQCYICSVW